MLHIILTILKIIGIILAVLLGGLLAFVLLVLFIPIGYCAKLDNQKNLLVKMNIWWLFHALSFSFFYEKKKENLNVEAEVEQNRLKEQEGLQEEVEKSPIIKVKILGISIINTSREKEKKKEDSVYEETMTSKNETEEIEHSEVVPKIKSTKEKQIKNEKQIELIVQEIKKEPVSKETLPDFLEDKGIKKQNSKENLDILEKEIKEKTKQDSKEELDILEKKGRKEDKAEKKTKKQKNPKKEKECKQQRFGFLSFKEKIENIKQLIHNAIGKVELIKAFFCNEENKKGIKKTFSSIKNILKRLLPRKIEGKIAFGTSDPCVTGQVLGLLSLFYPYYGKSVSIQPDFSKQMFEGSLYVKGHITIITLCWIVIKLVLSANFRKLIKNVLQLKEELINGGK